MGKEITLNDLAKSIDDLAIMVKGGFDNVDLRLVNVEERLDGVEQRLDGVELRLDQAAYRFELVELTHRVDKIENKVGL